MLELFFPIWDFLHNHSRIKGLQGKGEGILLTPQYHFHLLHRHLDIGRGNITGGSPLIRVSHVVALLAVFILFYGQSWQGGVFNTMKIDHFLVL